MKQVIAVIRSHVLRRFPGITWLRVNGQSWNIENQVRAVLLTVCADEYEHHAV